MKRLRKYLLKSDFARHFCLPCVKISRKVNLWNIQVRARTYNRRTDGYIPLYELFDTITTTKQLRGIISILLGQSCGVFYIYQNTIRNVCKRNWNVNTKIQS